MIDETKKKLSDEELKLKKNLQRKKYEEKFKRVTFRFTPLDIEEIEKEVSKTNLSFQTFCIKAIKKMKINSKEEDLFKSKLTYEVNKIGVNLNQIARAVNQKDRIAVLSELVEIEKELMKIRVKYGC